MNEYDISEAFRRIENDLIESLIRNLSKHRAQEEKEGLNWDAWQTAQLRELEKYRKQNAHRFDDDFEEINQAIKDLMITEFSHGVGDDPLNPDRGEFRNLADDGENPRRRSPFFGVNSERMDALLDATQQDFEKAEHAVLRKANDEYRKIIFDAQVYANQGGTYEKAVDMATKDFLKRGITSIVYKNGARHTISDYSRMALRTGAKRAYLMGLGQQMARIGVHTIRVERRDGACPFCTPWLGRVLIDDVYNEGTAEEARQKGYPLLSEAIDQGFLHPNCKDVYSMYIEGVSKPEDPMTDGEKDDLQKIYDLEQELKKAQGIRDSYERMAWNSLGIDDNRRYSILAKKWGDRVEELEEQLKDLKQKVGMETAPDEVPETRHGGIRELIDVEKETKTLGVFEIPEGAIEFGESWESDDTDYHGKPYHTKTTMVKGVKQISLPWEGFGKKAQSNLRWWLPDYREGKPFLIQKKDLEYATMRWDSRWDKGYSAAIRWFEDNGYEFLGVINIRKYNEPFRIEMGRKDGKLFAILESLVEDSFTVTQGTVDKVLAREKIVSKYLWDHGVPFGDIRSRGDRWDKSIEDAFNRAMEIFHTGVEADYPVSLVSRQAYEQVKGEEIYRGIAKDSRLRLGIAPPPKDCARQLMEGGVGDCFPSRGIYGDGVGYWSNSTDIGNNYSSHSEGVIVRAKIKDDARTIMYDDAVALFEAIYQRHPNDGSVYFSKDQRGSRDRLEVGKAMQILGYDVIIKPDGDGSGSTFYIVLNRNALVGIAGDYIWKLIG